MPRIKLDNRTKEVIQQQFLDDLEITGNVSMSAKRVKVGRRTIYVWLKEDEAFKERFNEAAQIGIDLLEDEAQRRALHGTSKPVYQGGKKVGVVQEYSDTLLIFLLKGKKPEVYKERHEHTGKDGAPIKTEFTVTMVTTGPAPASTEKDIDLD